MTYGSISIDALTGTRTFLCDNLRHVRGKRRDSQSAQARNESGIGVIGGRVSVTRVPWSRSCRARVFERSRSFVQ